MVSSEAYWDRTIRMNERLEREKKNLEGTLYKGRPIIQRDSPIDGGVYIGEKEREAIVVDSQKFPELNKLFEKTKARATFHGKVNKNLILQAVYDTVKEAYPNNDSNDLNSLLSKHNVHSDQKIALDVFLKEGIGVCRHTALTCGVLLELFKKKGYLKGTPSIDRNTIPKIGGHAWCRYTNSSGEVFILDPVQNYLGKLSEVPKNHSWIYKRFEDK